MGIVNTLKFSKRFIKKFLQFQGRDDTINPLQDRGAEEKSLLEPAGNEKGQGNSAEFPGLSFWRHELRALRSQRSVYFASRVAPLLAFFIGRRPKRKEEDAKEAIRWAFYFGKIVLPPAKPLQVCRKRQF